MANMITNNNNPNCLGNSIPVVATAGPTGTNPNMSAKDVVGGHGVGGISNLREISDYLLPNGVMSLAPGQCPYDHIIEMIRGLDLEDDGITMNHKIKSIETDFCNIVRDENMLCESMAYINDKALEDGETALKFALLFASRNFDVLAMKETKVRTAMLTLLQKNFVNSDTYRLYDRERLYNSITLLGEYYHRVRLADNAPITILGESLLSLLIREISEEKNVNNVKLAKLILSQITINGGLLRNLHNSDLSQLLYHIRKNLIEQPNLKPNVKAIMLMTLDLFYSNFESLGSQLEVMYEKYLIMEDDDVEDMGNNNQNQSSPTQSQPTNQLQQSPQQLTQYSNTCPGSQRQSHHSGYDENPLPSSSNNTSYENGDSGNVNDNTEEDQDNYKNWTDQVCEDSLEECDLNVGGGVVGGGGGNGSTGRYQNNHGDDRDQLHSSNSRYDNDPDRQSRNSRRSYQPRQSPRPLNQNYNRQNENSYQNARDSQNSGNEERDESKPLPRWRAPRFNRDDQHKDNRGRNAQRRFSASFDDDRQSVRSDGGSIRLYSINDRLKHAQEKIERSGNSSTYSGIANSNWDRQSQRDDRSERSYMSNYERGSNHRRGGRHYNQRPMYDKPPRFQKNKGANNGGENKNQSSETWRRSNSNLKYYDENSSYNNTNGPESNSRSSSRARTLPRPAKSRMEGGTNNSFRRSQSPNSYQRGGGGGGNGGGMGGNHHNSHNNNHHNKNRTRQFGNRYSSQSSLASEASSTLDRHHHQRNRSFSRRNPSMQHHQQPPKELPQQQPQNLPPPPRKEKENEDDWTDNEATNSELVRNARETTNYMNYLSSK
ncbi:putative uncharacterized protein DDB_G0286901 isoform X1 [Stomoxys calcitrans]|nr:putative uncharacterized protein DDB_G0286901 isoform X1 [Stomoxys calcitrans]